MQKMMAILVSVLYYIGAFMLLFHFSLGRVYEEKSVNKILL